MEKQIFDFFSKNFQGKKSRSAGKGVLSTQNAFFQA